MKPLKAFLMSSFLIVTIACSQKENTKIITVKNELDIERSFETVELTKDFLKVVDLTTIGIRNAMTGELEVSQLVDMEGDGISDLLLFQPMVGPKSESTYAIVSITATEKPVAIEHCYSRFVPERTDDYAWENDKVAFRTFGPTAQKMFEENVQGGTLTSGIDAWLKKVPYPVINKWYKKNTDGSGSYHEDTGEGLDNFHVGKSRGVGGLSIKKDSTYYFSKNFTAWRTITTGPIRTSFYLEYEAWDAGGEAIKESKIISLDYGSNLSKFEVSISSVLPVSVGLTLHEKDGVVTGDTNKGWVSYWEPHETSELGTAIVAFPDDFLDFETYDTPAKDLSNAYAHLKVNENMLTYYAGFVWQESGQFKNTKEWEQYLDEFAAGLKSPLTVTLSKP